MRHHTLAVCVAVAFAATSLSPLTAQQPAFTIEQVLAPPFPDNLVAAPAGGAVAWLVNANGAPNIWVAVPPEYQGRQVTAYPDDDGQEIGDLAWTPDGKAIVYTRGGGVNGRGEFPNPRSLTTGVKQEIWLVIVPGGATRRLGEGNSPAVSPKGDRVAFLQRGQVWWASLAEPRAWISCSAASSASSATAAIMRSLPSTTSPPNPCASSIPPSTATTTRSGPRTARASHSRGRRPSRAASRSRRGGRRSPGRSASSTSRPAPGARS